MRRDDPAPDTLTVVGGELHPADGEFTEVGYFDPATPPPLAFPTDALVLANLASEAAAP